MTMFAQDDDGDFLITNNGLTLVSGDEEIRQRIINALRSFFREWFLDLTLGVPWFQLIFEKGTPPQVIDAILKDKILSVPGVVSFRKWDPLDLDNATRDLSVDFSVRTVNGTNIDISEVVP